MNYIGSKFSLLGFLDESISSVVGGDLSNLTFCDMFAGTGVVGAYFKNCVKKLIANDIEPYSYALNNHYIKNDLDENNLENLVNKYTNLPPKKGKIFEFYAPGGGNGRQYFSDENACRIDAIRQGISELKPGSNEHFAMIASLLESADMVANTASVYGAFLKIFKKTAIKPLNFSLAKFTPPLRQNEVYMADANKLIEKISGDILYLDPPYNHREYGANYHLLNTITLYDDFTPRGKTGLREYKKSLWCKKQTVMMVFQDLIKKANFKYIFLSYNNEGLMSEVQIREILSRYGRYDLVKRQHQRFRADKEQNRNHKASSTLEYLHILEKF